MNAKGFLMGVLLALMVFSTNSFAQGWKFEVTAGGLVPMSDLKDFAGAGGGFSFHLGHMFSESWMGKAVVGMHKFASEEVSSSVDISGGFAIFKVGVTRFWGASKRFHTGPSLGIYRGVSDFDGSDFGLGPRIGYLFPLGDGGTQLDLAVEYHTVFADPDNLTYFGLNVGLVLNFAGL